MIIKDLVSPIYTRPERPIGKWRAGTDEVSKSANTKIGKVTLSEAENISKAFDSIYEKFNYAYFTQTQPSYTNLIKDRVDIYVKDGVCIKNRAGLVGKDLTSVIENIMENDLGEITIETDGLLKIYTNDIDRYKDVIKYLIDSYGLDILGKIKFIRIK